MSEQITFLMTKSTEAYKMHSLPKWTCKIIGLSKNG